MAEPTPGGDLHPARIAAQSLLRDCDTRRQRRSGPGGQHRNKVETGIFLRHRPTNIEVSATERRSQQENLRAAIHRLRVALAVQVRSPVQPEKVPSELWQSRCQHQKIRVRPSHDDFPALLSEALDVVIHHRDDIALAASVLDCTPSQLVKLIQQEPQAIALVNQRRRDKGLPLLK